MITVVSDSSNDSDDRIMIFSEDEEDQEDQTNWEDEVDVFTGDEDEQTNWEDEFDVFSDDDMEDKNNVHKLPTTSTSHDRAVRSEVEIKLAGDEKLLRNTNEPAHDDGYDANSSSSSIEVIYCNAATMATTHKRRRFKNRSSQTSDQETPSTGPNLRKNNRRFRSVSNKFLLKPSDCQRPRDLESEHLDFQLFEELYEESFETSMKYIECESKSAEKMWRNNSGFSGKKLMNPVLHSYQDARVRSIKVDGQKTQFMMSKLAKKFIDLFIFCRKRKWLNKRKLFSRNFGTARWTPSSRRLLLSKNLGGDNVPVFIDIDVDDREAWQKERDRLRDLIYIRKNRPRTLCRTIENRIQEPPFACDCTIKGDDVCCCIGNEACLCWKSSIPRMRNAGLGRIAFDKIVYTNSAIFVCGKKCGCAGKCTNNLTLSRSRFGLMLVKRNHEMGFETIATEPIPPGEVIMPFVGELIGGVQLHKRAEKDSLSAEYSFQLYDRLEEGMVYKILKRPEPNCSLYIDPSSLGNVARFLAHSCLPNTIPVRIFRNSTLIEDACLAIVSTEPIPVNHPVTFNYGVGYLEQQLGDKCLCKSPNCVNKDEVMKMEPLSYNHVCYSYMNRLHDLIHDIKDDLGEKDVITNDNFTNNNSVLGKKPKAQKLKNGGDAISLGVKRQISVKLIRRSSRAKRPRAENEDQASKFVFYT